MESNPYAAPRSAVSDVTPERRRRPVLVWIITILMAIGIVSGVATSIAGLLGNPIGGPQANPGMRWGDYLWATALSAASIPAYVQLFRLKRSALPWVAWIFVAAVAAMFVNLGLRPEYRAMFEQMPGGYLGILVGWAVNLAIIGYVWRLRAKGVLQ